MLLSRLCFLAICFIHTLFVMSLVFTSKDGIGTGLLFGAACSRSRPFSDRRNAGSGFKIDYRQLPIAVDYDLARYWWLERKTFD